MKSGERYALVIDTVVRMCDALDDRIYAVSVSQAMVTRYDSFSGAIFWNEMR